MSFEGSLCYYGRMLKYIIMITEKIPSRMYRLEAECREKGIYFNYMLPETVIPIKETLYITDHPLLCDGLLEEGANVLVWLHEDNRGGNFSKAPYMVEKIEEVDYTYLEKIYCRFMNLPWQIGETKRCLIREMTEGDLEDLYRIYSGKNITQYMEGLFEDRQKELEYIKSYIENAYKFYGYGTWQLIQKETGEAIGRAGLNLRDGFEEPELGFVICEEQQKKGYAYECCRKILEIAYEEYEIKDVQALIREGNLASIRLCEKLGFSFSEIAESEGNRYLRYLIRITV